MAAHTKPMILFRGLHSTVVVFALLTPWPVVRIPALLRYFSSAEFVDSGDRNRTLEHGASDFANAVQRRPDLSTAKLYFCY